jgi:hypothetical protein
MPHTLFKVLGITVWTACILVLGYQAASWIVTASWPSVTLMDTTGRVGLDLLALARSLPLEFAIKAAYVLITTELAIALWWTGVGCFALAFITATLFGR